MVQIFFFENQLLFFWQTIVNNEGDRIIDKTRVTNIFF